MKVRQFSLLTLTISLFLFIANQEVKSQELENIEQLLEHQLQVQSNHDNLFFCFEIIKQQGLERLFINIPFGFPLDSSEEKFHITSLYGIRNHPIEKKIKIHRGIDIAAKIGTYISCTANGIVEDVQISESGYGKKITIRHKYGFSSVYAHLAYIAVKKGEKVVKGKIIGLMGSTGASTGTHLHYEIHKNKNKIDPKRFIIYRSL